MSSTPTPTRTATATPTAVPDPPRFACYQSAITSKVCVNLEGEVCTKDADCGGVKGSCTNKATAFQRISGVMLSDQFATDATFRIEAPDRLCAPASPADVDGSHLLRFPLTLQQPAVETLFPPLGCAPCSGGATYLRMRYTGASAATVMILDRRGAALLNRSVGAGEAFDLFGGGASGTFQSPLQIWVGGQLRGALVTDCGEPLGPGLVPAAGFVVLEARSRNTGTQPLCPVIKVQNQLETVFVTRGAPRQLLVPSWKDLPETGDFRGGPLPEDVDHFECYDVLVAGTRPTVVMQTSDQFYNNLSRPKLGPERNLNVLVPRSLCNPAIKEGPVPGAQPQNPAPLQSHLLCYDVRALNAPDKPLKGLYLEDQLGLQRLDLAGVKELCVPSSVMAPAPLP